jgi:hypothetical protein
MARATIKLVQITTGAVTYPFQVHSKMCIADIYLSTANYCRHSTQEVLQHTRSTRNKQLRNSSHLYAYIT